MIKSRRMRWAGHVARMEAKRNVYRVLVGSQKERDHLEDLNVDGENNFEMDLREIEWVWTEFVWFRIETSDRLL
jgi:hypothetical protein